ncbi:MAG: carotenoid oxygenase family protein [Anaerolineae bacterium]|nr:carotenoid oxygenase family protein [Gloeobacterales cyanobacterium ES-bin-313]
MVSAPSIRPTWSKAIARPAKEFALTPLQVIAGKLPEGLHGTLYRNGPGRLERGGVKVGHWFDGDGAILAVHFGQEGARGTYRYVQTEGYLAEEKAGKFLYSNYGMTAPGPIWERWGKSVKNAANTSVIALPDRLLALWEGGLPHALDLETLETQGTENLSYLHKGLSYSAHPKRDPKTGEIFNFGVSIGVPATLHLYCSDERGRIRRQGAVKLDGIPLIHDFVMAGPYLIFCIPPVRINAFPVGFGLQSYSDAMAWKPELGTQILVIDRETLTLVARGEAEPWYQWHFSNGYVEADGTVVIDLVRYEDFKTNSYLGEFVTGETRTVSPAWFWRMRIDPRKAKVLSGVPLLSRSCEFPTMMASEVGQPSQFAYLALYRSGQVIGQDFFGTVGRLDLASGNLVIAPFADGHYPSEPIYVQNLTDLENGWVLTVVYNSAEDSSELWICDASHLDTAPICRLALPQVIPPGFHGTWRSAPPNEGVRKSSG